MSYSGVYSGLYARIRDYAELLDDVLINIKAGRSSPSDSRRQQLAQLFLGTSVSTGSNLSIQLFKVFLRDAYDLDQKHLTEIGQALLSVSVGSNIVDRLERFAHALENERAGMLAKMRGHD